MRRATGVQVSAGGAPFLDRRTDKKRQGLVYDVRGRLDGSIVAIIVNEPNVSRFTKVREAWRADSRVRRFDLVPLEGVSCEDPDRGPE